MTEVTAICDCNHARAKSLRKRQVGADAPIPSAAVAPLVIFHNFNSSLVLA